PLKERDQDGIQTVDQLSHPAMFPG
ncbi:MAG: hypothetical protein K0T01_1976, partial [Acidimicrobiia bacterium]|nr:hypothetical protein [Acidimicrobiia bacterium]